MTRRGFVETTGAFLAAALARPASATSRHVDTQAREPLFRISLAEWSLHRSIEAGRCDNLDFPVVARRDYAFDAVEYVNTFFRGMERDAAYLRELRTRADDHGVTSLLIMCDGEGAVGDPNERARATAVENHYRWVEAAQYLGCHSIRVNAQSEGSPTQQRALAVDGLRRITEFAAERDISVLVENHGGLSSNGGWLAGVIAAVGHPGCGTLPDFGNFELSDGEWYDRYQGVGELMPFAKAVSAKSHEFDAQGNERHTEYGRMLRIVLDAGYRGHIGIEYEGTGLSEPDGIRATKALLERTRTELEGAYR
ncbi:MAG: sugar phosphate isomerase/epimerase [Gemmatimonadota bacterium]|nr:MAG: sugar phosphate isomerase/epimerase [Gemmatimonadota bacterium]